MSLAERLLQVIAWVIVTTVSAALVLYVCCGVIAFAMITLDPDSVRPISAIDHDRHNLLQIGHSISIYATDYKEKLPQADTIWDYAAHLAESAGLAQASYWQTYNLRPSYDTPVLLSEPKSPRRINPEFLAQTPTVAVASGTLTRDMPATTPIAWTAGLKSDGYWSKESAYSGDGGLICFLEGDVKQFANLHQDGGALVHFITREKTSNILDALPPGTVILEAPQATFPNLLKKQRLIASARSIIQFGWLVWVPLVFAPVNFLLLRASGLHQRRMPKWLLLVPTGWALCLILAMVVVRHL